MLALIEWLMQIEAPRGLCELTENRHDGLCQLTSEAYPLRGVHVITDPMIQRVVIEIHADQQTATGVELEL